MTTLRRFKTLKIWVSICGNAFPLLNKVSELMVRSKGENIMIYGYARVSTAMQQQSGNSLEDQTKLLESYGCQEIITEAFSGKTMERPQFQSLLGKLREGDTLVVCKLDRFARTAIEGVQTVRELFERGVRVHILNMGLIENTLTGNLILTVMLAFAEYERGMIVERTQTGKAIAKANPSFREGRPPKYNKIQLNHAIDLLHSGMTYKQVEQLTGISKSTLIRNNKKSSVQL